MQDVPVYSSAPVIKSLKRFTFHEREDPPSVSEERGGDSILRKETGFCLDVLRP